MKIQRKFWLSDSEAIVSIMFVIITIGTINISSASLITAYNNYDDPYFFVTRHIIFIVLGTIMLLVMRSINYTRLKRLAFPLILVSILALIAVIFVGITINGSRRWISLGFMQFQPSELAKLATILYTAAYLGNCLNKNIPIQLSPLKNGTLLFCGIIFVLVEQQPDMGTSLIILGIPVLMYFIAGISKKWIAAACGIGSAGLIFFATFQPYRLSRIKNWYDPWDNLHDEGYQIVQSILSIGSGGFAGMGLGHGFSKYSYLPESHTDFAFAVLCQELGFVGAFFIFVLFLALAAYCTRVARRAKDNFAKLLICGIIMLIVGQAVCNMAMVIGLIPVVGIPLPFISYGGTSLLLNMISIGIVLNIDKHNPQTVNLVPSKKNNVYQFKQS